jgi:hypothetical protein
VSADTEGRRNLTERPIHVVSFREASRFWIKLGFINFGGPTGQIGIMHDELVERRKWISNARSIPHDIEKRGVMTGTDPEPDPQ